MYKKTGFTLIELMVVLLIISILAAVALPSYVAYGRRSAEAVAQQEINNLAMQLDRHKARQLNYLKFSKGATAPVVTPSGATGMAVKYNIYIKDGSGSNPSLMDSSALGMQWVIRAESTDPQLASYLLTSKGLRCKNKTLNNITYSDCGVGGEAW